MLNYKYIGEGTSMEDCVNYLKNKEVLSLDIETTRKYNGKYGDKEGLDPYLSKIVMLQIGDKNTQFVIDVRTVDIKLLYPVLVNPNVLLVGQNIKFEYKHLLHNYNIKINNLYDTMVVEQILHNGLNVPVSLKELNKKYLDITVDKSTRLEFANIKDKPFTERQIEYGAEDVLYPLLIRDKQLEDAKLKEVISCINLEMKFIPVLGDMEYTGMTFSKEVWTNTYINNLENQKILIEKLDAFVITNFMKTNFVSKQLDLFDSGFKCLVQWSSPKQTIDLFRYLNICPQEVSKTTKIKSYTVNAKVLMSSMTTTNKEISETLKELILLYLEYKETSQACNTFGIKFFKHINPITNRIHSNYKQILNTGRISSSNPNLQNIPAIKEFRSAFIAKDNYKIVNADYAGQEQIILANKSNDKDLLYFYKQGLGDMHSYIASKIYPELADVPLADIKKYHKDKRQIAKGAGFAINYGGNGFTIAKNLGIDAEEGEFVYNAYFKAFPGLKKYFKKVQKESLSRGYILIDNITGRKNWFESPKNKMEKSSIERAALNFPIQGEAGSITKLAGIYFRRELINNKLEDVANITNIVHDEINVEVREDYSAQIAKLLEQSMEKAGDLWCKTIKLKAEAAISDYWTH